MWLSGQCPAANAIAGNPAGRLHQLTRWPARVDHTADHEQLQSELSEPTGRVRQVSVLVQLVSET